MSSTGNFKIKKITTFFGVIMIGAIGSGLWDLFLKGLLFKIGDLLVNAVAYFNSNYVDYLYSSVQNGSHMEIVPTVAIFIIIISLPFIYWTRISTLSEISKIDKENQTQEMKEPSQPINRNFKKNRIVFFILFLFVSLLYTDTLIKATATFKAYTTIERNLEIIHPYVSDVDYYILRSRFRQIDSKQKVIDLVNSINKIANNNKITLPAYHLLGINI